MPGIRKWLHHLFNPHCQICREDSRCLNCDTLREILETEKREKERILSRLLEVFKQPEVVAPVEQKELKPLGKPFVPMRVRMDMLAQADKERAASLGQVGKQIIDSPSIKIEDLEDSLGVSNANQ